MNLRFSALCLVALGGIGGLIAPSTAEAGNVGYFKNDSLCTGHLGNASAAIVAAGHTPKLVTNLDNASLTGLSALIVSTCGTWSSNATVNSAVASGMGLVIDVGQGYAMPSTTLPGSPTFQTFFGCTQDVDVAGGSPIATGPGGSIDDSSFDFQDGLCNFVGYVPVAQLPAGAHAFLLDGIVDSNVVAFGYPYGNGKVAFSPSQISRQLPGATASDYPFPMQWAPAVVPYFANALAWVMPADQSPTCASEGYTGTKLTWCQNICEKGYTGATLNSWIKRWTDKYRDLPYCAK